MKFSNSTKATYTKISKKYASDDYSFDDPKVFFNQIKKEKTENGTVRKYTTLKTIMYAMRWKFNNDENKVLYDKYDQFITDVVKPLLTKEYENTKKTKYDDMPSKDDYAKKLNEYLDDIKKKEIETKDIKTVVERNKHVVNIRAMKKYFVIGSLYVLMKPRRILDYSSMKLAKTLKNTSDTKSNYFICSTNTFVFNKYKTAGKYGQDKVKSPTQMTKLLKEFIKINSIMDGNDLFASPKTIERALIDIFGQSVNFLRHAQVNEDFKGVPIQDIVQSAREMGHSVGTHVGYLTK